MNKNSGIPEFLNPVQYGTVPYGSIIMKIDKNTMKYKTLEMYVERGTVLRIEDWNWPYLQVKYE